MQSEVKFPLLFSVCASPLDEHMNCTDCPHVVSSSTEHCANDAEAAADAEGGNGQSKYAVL